LLSTNRVKTTMEIQSVSLRGRKTAALWTDTSLSLVSVAKRIEALQIACFLAFFRTIFLVIYVCVLSHVYHEAS
jgi:hypothetical protein